MNRYSLPLIALTLGVSLSACSQPDDGVEGEPASTALGENDYVKVLDEKGDASVEAIFLDFEFDGEVLTNSTFNLSKQIEDQMLYTIGHLNGDNSVGRLDKLVLTDIETERTTDGKTRVTYHATILVAWGNKENVPTSYTFRLPHDISFEGQENFAEKYSTSCVDWGARDVDAGSMWYYYRPAASRCDLDEADVIEIEAAASVSDVNTTGKYPEYDKVWEDDALKVVAVFGKYKDGATSSSDAGIAAYNTFVRTMKTELGALDSLETEPAEVPTRPGVDADDITFRATFGERSVEVTTLLVDNVRTAGADFDRRYEELSGDADLIVYNGHAGLGANIRALAQKGRWVQGQYSIVFMNGCDTYAYVDSSLTDARAAINPDDPNGTKYLDIITNAMPSFFREMSNATLQLIRGLMMIDDPQTYEQMFTRIDADEVVIVSGEEDNVYVPGGGEEPVDEWGGMAQTGSVTAGEEVRFATPTLPEGSYRFELTGDEDADLYVRIGNEPTTESYDCRPFRTGSFETCEIDLAAPTTIHVMVRGWNPESNYELIGR